MQLILGGARSGKSRIAEERALAWAQQKAGRTLVYLATATPGDAAMTRRISHHQARRAADQHLVDWQLAEAPLGLAETLRTRLDNNTGVVVDCLTLWISNCLHAGTWATERKQLLDLVSELAEQRDHPLIMVSNEVGSGIVPLGELSREFVDASGHLHQSLARHCRSVTLVVAGLELELKPGTSSV